MKIEKVTYQKTFVTGPYMNEKIGFEVQLDDGDTDHSALDYCKDSAEMWHRKNNPHLYQDSVNAISQWQSQDHKQDVITTYASNQPIIIDKSIERLEVAIDNCQSIEELDQLKKDNPLFPAKLLETFNNKRKQLTSGSAL